MQCLTFFYKFAYLHIGAKKSQPKVWRPNANVTNYKHIFVFVSHKHKLRFGEIVLCLIFCSRVDFIHMGNGQTRLGTLPNSSTVLILIRH